MIDVSAYLEIADLFRFRYDPAVLGLLAERPHRFRELVKRVETHVEDHVDDNAVDRSLKRLVRDRHVHKTLTRIGRRVVPLYNITVEGRHHLKIYGAFIATYQSRDLPGAHDTPPDAPGT